MRSAQVTFDLADRAAEETFLQSYMVDAWDRYQSHDAFDRAWFWRFGNTSDHGPLELEGGNTLEGGGVVLVLNGEPAIEQLLEDEQDRWDALDLSGFLDYDVTWFHPEYENARQKAIENFGKRGGDRAYRLRPLASRMTLNVLEEFDGRLPAVGETSEEDPLPVGYWTTIHFLMKQSGFDWFDEIDACTRAIKNRLDSLAGFHGKAAARDAQMDALDDLRGYNVNV
ncbi:hypothetical protein [Salinarchaeum laminariae]|uniref:hypothetical protein n=1 Tax=Salinarchaeum laminariae TaxID=869888 RepID=UPI0020BF94A7|nr:hypothetical protein [Salinarchaeum laminariae]